jgi:hypothetical protein
MMQEIFLGDAGLNRRQRGFITAVAVLSVSAIFAVLAIAVLALAWIGIG